MNFNLDLFILLPSLVRATCGYNEVLIERFLNSNENDTRILDALYN